MRSKNKILLEFIREEFQKINNSVQFLNAGGCGIFAEFAYQALLNAGLKPELAIITRQKEMHKSLVIENLRKRAKAYDIPFSHVVIVLNGKLIDSRGFYDKHIEISEHYAGHDFVVGLDVELLKQWNENPYNWNNLFDRRFIPTIKKRMKQFEKTVKWLV